ncbi:MAG: type II 3-dehydroquinate dehydratase, partial [Candidatus Fonsibacter ubiquis]
MNIVIINGPNLNLLGEREPKIYGKETLKSIEKKCKEHAKKNKIKIDFFQSNIEGEIV